MIGHWFVMTKHVTRSLVHPDESLQVLGRLLMLQYDLSANNPPVLTFNDSTPTQTLTLHSDVNRSFGSVMFPEFGAKQFSHLWQGGGEDFGARNCSDGHWNTLALIFDSDGHFSMDSLRWSGGYGNGIEWNGMGSMRARITVERPIRVQKVSFPRWTIQMTFGSENLC
jgi:hypothetical protein